MSSPGRPDHERPPFAGKRMRSRIASCASSATQTAVSLPGLSSLARCKALRRLDFIRSPGMRGISDAATTMH